MPVDYFAVSLGVAATVLDCSTIFRLHYTRLHRRFRVLIWFLCIDVIRKLALLGTLCFPHPRSAYASVWILTEPVVWISYVLLVLDLYLMVLENYPGLKTVGRWVCLACLSFSVFMAVFFTLVCCRGHSGNSILSSYATVGGTLMSSLAVFMFVSLSLLASYPIAWSRNVVVHAGVCVLLIISGGVSYFLHCLDSARFSYAVNVPSQMVVILGLSAWLLLLRPNDEPRLSTC
jgi:hypothetical protein